MRRLFALLSMLGFAFAAFGQEAGHGTDYATTGRAIRIASATEYANVLVNLLPHPSEGEPLTAQSFHVPDWTTGAGPIVLNSATVARAILSGNHLISAADTLLTGIVLPGAATDYEILVNETQPHESAFYFSLPKAAEAVLAEVYPSAGTYGLTIEIGFSRPAGVEVYYSLDGGAWILFADSAPLFLHRSAELRYYAKSGADTGPVKTANYTIVQRGDVDTDGDRIPDFIEIGRGWNPLVYHRDTDNDNWNDFDELLRGSDPESGGSVPADSDAPSATVEARLAWSDYDEALRQTDPSDSASEPMAPGMDVAEYILTGEPGEKMTPGAGASPEMTENSRVEFYNLSGIQVASATIEGGSFSVRLAGDQPWILKAIEANNVDVALLKYIPSYWPCLNAGSIYAEGMTEAEWLAGYGVLYESLMFTEFSGDVFDATGMVTALAMGRFFETAIPLAGPVVLSDASDSPVLEDIAALAGTYDFDDVAASFDESVALEPDLSELVRTFIEWARDTDPDAPIHRILSRAVHGETIPATGLPPGVAQAQLDNLRNRIDAAVMVAPSRIRQGTGTLVSDPRGFQTLSDDGVTYWLDFGNLSYIPGSTVHVEGVVEKQCEYPDVVKLTVTALSILSAEDLENNLDSDLDGLFDQWEYFFFGELVQSATGDPDGDLFDNLAEQGGYTHPNDAGSNPGLTPTPTPSVTATPTPSMTPTPTSGMETPTPTATPIKYDFYPDLKINWNDLYPLIHGMKIEPATPEESFDYKNLFEFSSYWMLGED